MRGLIELRLPQLVEARKKRGSGSSDFDLSDSPTLGNGFRPSRSSTSSEAHSPISPTFSLRGHGRFPSSTSSIASSPVPRDSLDGFGTLKRPLTDVKEEPHEKEEDMEMIDEVPVRAQPLHHDDVFDLSNPADEGRPSMASSGDYDWLDSPCYDEDYASSISSKRRRADDNFLHGTSSRLSSRFPSLSRKWKARNDQRKPNLADTFQEVVASRSRANSVRVPSLNDTIIDFERRDASLPQLPATPKSIIEDSNESRAVPVDSDDEDLPLDVDDDDVPRVFATTPLLPPVLALMSDTVVRSPLQSPKIADSPATLPPNPFESPRWNGLPSPPLSNKPSVSSFHHRQLLPASEIPPILLEDHPQDEWTNKLGHANFIIHPEPYLPPVFDLASCRQLRADWELARCNFMKHLARTGEHYSTTSKIYQLTEEKWAQLDGKWRTNHDYALSLAASDSQEALALSKHCSFTEPAPLAKIPSINGPRSEGKFPKVGDEGIVGPMTQSPPLWQRPSKKRAFWKFVQGVLPSSIAFGRAVA